jgi:hypothetical protein
MVAPIGSNRAHRALKAEELWGKGARRHQGRSRLGQHRPPVAGQQPRRPADRLPRAGCPARPSQPHRLGRHGEHIQSGLGDRVPDGRGTAPAAIGYQPPLADRGVHRPAPHRRDRRLLGAGGPQRHCAWADRGDRWEAGLGFEIVVSARSAGRRQPRRRDNGGSVCAPAQELRRAVRRTRASDRAAPGAASSHAGRDGGEPCPAGSRPPACRRRPRHAWHAQGL